MLISGLILGLYLWSLLFDTSLVSRILFVHSSVAISAGATFALALSFLLWAPQRWLYATGLVSYIGLVTTICLLIANTGSLASPLAGLGIMVALVSPALGWPGVAVIGAALAYFLGNIIYSVGLQVSELVIPTSLTVVSVVVGWLVLWRDKGTDETAPGQTATEKLRGGLSGKAEIVITAITDGVLALDSKGIIQLINPSAQKLIGWSVDDAVGLDYKSVLKIIDAKDKDIEPLNDPVRQAIETNKPVHTDSLNLQTADATKSFQADINVTPIGSLGSGVIVVFRDVTKEKAEEREQAEFISTASHEMRTPVASIEGYLGLALNPQTAQVDDKAREYIGKAQEAAKHLGRLFQDLLDVSRADDGRLSNNPRIVDVVPFLGDIAQGLAPFAAAKGIQVNYKPNPDFLQNATGGERSLRQILYVNVDNDHLREVLSNLIENAVKYTLEGSVTIDAEGDDQHVTISIKDSGIGIPKEDLGHLFQKFYRVDNTETREIGGTGLGLYLCRKLTEAMGGQIWADSQYRQGSTFYVRFPRVDYVEAKELIEQASSQSAENALVHPEIQPSVSNQQPIAAPTAPAVTPVVQPTALQATAQQPAPPTPLPQTPSAAPQPARQPVVRSRAVTANQAPVYQPGAQRPNTPLTQIESNPRQYIESTQRQSSGANPPRQQ